MKTKILLALITLMLISCQKQKTTTTTVEKDKLDTTGGTTGTGTTTGGSTTTTGSSTGTTTTGTTTSSSTSGTTGFTTGTTTTTSTTGTTTSGNGGGTCNGDSTDGVGTGSSIRVFNATLGGQGTNTDPRAQDWRPGRATGIPEWIPTVQEASMLFATDARLKVRVKILPQWFPSAGVMGCDGRQTGQASDSYPYTKLKMRIVLRDVIKNGTSYTLAANSYQDIITQPINVNSCSPVYDFSDKRNPSAFGTIVEIRDVMSDNECLANGLQCPAEKLLRRASCWKVVLEVATDVTKDLQ